MKYFEKKIMNKYIVILITAMLPAFIFSQEQEKVDGVVLDSEGSMRLVFLVPMCIGKIPKREW